MSNDNQIKIKETVNSPIKGRVKIYDSDRKLIMEGENAIHRHNLNHIIVRALSGRDNSMISKMAFGSGGTIIDSTYNVMHRDPNDGTPPHDMAGWSSRMYNETYSKEIDISDIEITEDDDKSRIIINVRLGEDEPQGQLFDDNVEPNTFMRNDYTFDEISLFSSGLGNISTRGYQLFEMDDKDADSLSGLEVNTRYYIVLDIGGGSPELTSFMTRERGSDDDGLTYRDIVTDFNNQIGVEYNVRLAVTDSTNDIFTDGYMRIENLVTGEQSYVKMENPPDADEHRRFIDSLIGVGEAQLPVYGSNAGVRNNQNDSGYERERLLTHITFDPVMKTANRTLEIEYIIEF